MQGVGPSRADLLRVQRQHLRPYQQDHGGAQPALSGRFCTATVLWNPAVDQPYRGKTDMLPCMHSLVASGLVPTTTSTLFALKFTSCVSDTMHLGRR
jgi:hypothetical protein